MDLRLTKADLKRWRRNDAAIVRSCKLLGVSREDMPEAVHKLVSSVTEAKRQLAELRQRI